MEHTETIFPWSRHRRLHLATPKDLLSPADLDVVKAVLRRLDDLDPVADALAQLTRHLVRVRPTGSRPRPTSLSRLRRPRSDAAASSAARDYLPGTPPVVGGSVSVMAPTVPAAHWRGELLLPASRVLGKPRFEWTRFRVPSLKVVTR